MKLTKPDILLIRWNLLIICVSAIVSAVALYGSDEYAKASQKELRDARSALNDARNRMATAQQDRENMAVYASEYGALSKLGVIGDDHRLDWMEGLEKVRRQNPVTDFRFNIAPQKPYAAQPPLDSGNFDVHYSEMKLQFDLLHEAQLPDFFAALRDQIKGRYLLEGCTLQRTARESAGATAPTHLTAECKGGWITLKNRSTK